MAKLERSVWLADSKPTAQATRHEVPSGISSQSWLTPIGAGFVPVQQRVTRQTRKYTARKVMPSFLANPADRRVCAIVRVELFVLGDGAVRTLQHGRRDAIGELPMDTTDVHTRNR